jgi:glyoxylase-like metal-dependent hydrolase (beta-lactamase superfamily II)
MTQSAGGSLASVHGIPFTPFTCDTRLKDGDELTFDGGVIKIIHTPGHTKGGVCFLADDNLFSGDTLFQQSVGRTDLPGGNMTTLLTSLEKLKQLPDAVKVFPGHGESTTIGEEKLSNPYLKRCLCS